MNALLTITDSTFTIEEDERGTIATGELTETPDFNDEDFDFDYWTAKLSQETGIELTNNYGYTESTDTGLLWTVSI